jgi:hypothetical protein
VRAYAWFNLGTAVAPASTRVLAVLARDRAAADLSPEDLARGQRLAREIHARIAALATGPEPPPERELAVLTPETGGQIELAPAEPLRAPDEPALAYRDSASPEVRAGTLDEQVVAAVPAGEVTVAPAADTPSLAVEPSEEPRAAAAAEGLTLAPAEDRQAQGATAVAPAPEAAPVVPAPEGDPVAPAPKADPVAPAQETEVVEALPPNEQTEGGLPLEQALAPLSERTVVASEPPVAMTEPQTAPRVSGESAVFATLDAGLAAYRALDYSRAAQVWLPLARSGHPGAQRLLGQLYLDGTGVPVNPVQAYFWWTLTAQQGDENAQSVLAQVAAPAADALVVARLLAESWTPAP